GAGPGSAAQRPRASPAGPPPPPVLEANNLRAPTSWAEAVAEALAYAPELLEATLVDSRTAAPWRAALGIAEPSLRLSQAIESLDQAVRAATPVGGDPTVDAVPVAVRNSRRDERPLDRLARRVLRSALEQRRTRQAKELGRLLPRSTM